MHFCNSLLLIQLSTDISNHFHFISGLLNQSLSLYWNKQTNEIAYIDRNEWHEILVNSSGKENLFEIIEELKQNIHTI